MLTFIFAIIGLLIIIGLISMLNDLENSIISCVIGIMGILVIYGLVTGVMDFMFWLGYQIGPYSIIVTILLILSPFIILYLYDKLKSKGIIDSLSNKIKENKKLVSIAIVIVILIIVVPIVTYNPLDSEPYTVECPEGSSIKDYKGVFVYDEEMRDGVAIGGDDVIISHHNAHGKNLKYYVKMLKKYHSPKSIEKINVSGIPAYDIIGVTAITDHWVIFVKDDECYLIRFDSNVDDDVRNQIINSFKFK